MAHLAHHEAERGRRAKAPRAPLRERVPWRERVLVAFAALLCLVFAAGLRDVPLSALVGLELAALPLDAPRDAAVSVLALDETGKPLPSASVRVFVMHEGRAHFAGERQADGDGLAVLTRLPRGEIWVLAYDEARARASSRVVLGKDPEAVELTLRPARALDVVVTDEDGRPLPNAAVSLTASDPLPYLARTGGEGQARLDRLGEAPYAVRIDAPGYDAHVRTGVVPTGGPLRIRLERLGQLVVRVVGEDGQPAAGATVLAAGTGLWPSRSTVTDEQGTARIGGLRAGVFDLQARLGGRVSGVELAIPLQRGEERDVELRLGAGRMVRVFVTDGEGEGAPPVAGASVVLAEDGLSSFPLHGRTDDRGEASLGPVAARSAVVGARAPGFVGRHVVRVEEDATEVRVGLVRGGTLVGEVVDDRGFPIPGATIEVVGVDRDGMPVHESTARADFQDDHFESSLAGPAPLLPMGELGVMPGRVPDLPREGAPLPSARSPRDPWTTRGDGAFEATPVTPGRIHALVRHPAYVEALSEPVTLVSGGEASVRVVLRRGGSLEGRVVEADGTPVAFARVELAALAGSLERLTYAAEDGTFAFAAVPDEIVLRVSRPQTPTEVAARLVVEIEDGGRKEVEVILPETREAVRIRVTDDRGYPLDRVEIHALSLDPAVSIRRTLFTDESGEASLPEAVGVALRLVVSRPSKAPLVEQLERAPVELTLALEPGREARGVVTSRSGRDRVEGAAVTLYTATGPRHAITDAEGEFSFKDVASGRVRLRATHAEFATGERVTRVGADLDSGRPADLGAVELAAAGEVEGRVVDAHGDPVAGARVAQDGVPTYLPLGALPPGIVATDRDGHYVLRGLPEGQVTLEAFFDDLGRAAVEGVVVRPGRTTRDVNLTMPQAGARPLESRGAAGLAVTLGELADRRDKAVVVMMVPAGSEAELAGLEPGDLLLEVDGVAVSTLETARRKLTGPLAEDLVLTLRRDEEPPASPVTWRTRVRRERVRR